MGRLFDFAKFKANIILLFRFGASFFQPKAFLCGSVSFLFKEIIKKILNFKKIFFWKIS